MMTMGSLFDGIGGFPLAARRNGIATLWASEIEPFPIRVTKLRFPEMVHLGDITKLDGAKLPPVDIICGGSPCQDLSVAGARAGLAGSRSGLFMEQIRIIREMRDADKKRGRTGLAVRPRFGCWENVLGAFSSAEGKDFQAVLQAFIGVEEPQAHTAGPPSGRWEPAGAILGIRSSLAWATWDAQYFGVPQRRRRVFLVADFAGYSPIQILFEQGRLFGDTAESGAEGKSPAASAEGGPGTPGGGIFAFHINQREETIDLGGVAGALMATTNMQMQTFVASGVYSEIKSTADGKGPGVLCLNDQGGERMGCTYDQTATLRSQTRGHEPLVFENHTLDSRCTGPHKAAPTISAAYGTGGNNTSLVVEDQVYARQRADCFQEDEVASTQSARQHKDTTDLVLHPADPPRLIRRLTPLECERLQGFPDGWTEIPGASDSARYRALGNSVAIPCVEYLFRGVAYFLGREAPFR